jgi:hypothetical protein
MALHAGPRKGPGWSLLTNPPVCLIRSSEMTAERVDPKFSMLKLRFYLYRIVVTFLNRHYLRLKHKNELIQSWFGDIEKPCTHRGTVDTIGYIKSIRLACTRYLCEQPLQESPGFGVQLDSMGLPKGVPLVELFRDRYPPQLRLGFTLLGISRTLPGWKSPDLSPITDPLQIFLGFQAIWWQSLRN